MRAGKREWGERARGRASERAVFPSRDALTPCFSPPAQTRSRARKHVFLERSPCLSSCSTPPLRASSHPDICQEGRAPPRTRAHAAAAMRPLTEEVRPRAPRGREGPGPGGCRHGQSSLGLVVTQAVSASEADRPAHAMGTPNQKKPPAAQPPDLHPARARLGGKHFLRALPPRAPRVPPASSGRMHSHTPRPAHENPPS